MTDDGATLVLGPIGKLGPGVLEKYLALNARAVARILPGPAAEQSDREFRSYVSNLTGKLEEFLTNGRRTESHLVLGKVQSGKTAHLLAMLAWAADAGIGAAVVFTGTTGSLNDQTVTRIQKDLGGAGGDLVRVFRVPTVRSRRQFASFGADLKALMRQRSAGSPTDPFPVLVAMKNRARAGAIEAALREVAQELGSATTVLVIDDEADQASQNSFARRRSVAPTYRAMGEVRQLPLRNIWLSYTATPQAVLLTEKFGLLRPDAVTVLPPRAGYFGIADAMSGDFESNLVVVDDWRVRASQQQSRPRSLSEAIWRFFFVSWVRTAYPERFYSRSMTPVSATDRLRSTQMLVHESGFRTDHSRMARLVEDECDDLALLIRKAVAGDKTAEGDLRRGFSPLIAALEPTGEDVAGLMDDLLSPEGMIDILNMLEDCEVLVVNSDAAAIRKERPVEDRDYERRRCWILVGGDILGRGITIPQLVVTYFIRSSKTPNFDTVMQQLRFCGYRSTYAPWTSLHAPQQTFEDLKLMEIVDRALWERASNWDRERVRLTGEKMPRVYYAAPHHARFEPTRASVRDPDLIDRRLRGDSLAGLRRIFEPQDTLANLALIKRWKTECDLVPTRQERGWEVFEDVPKSALARLLTSWVGDDDEIAGLSALAELFDPALEELGLFDVPAVVFVRRALATFAEDPMSLPNRLDEITVTRHAHVPNAETNLAAWREAFLTRQYLAPSRRAMLATPHVGAGQRALRNWLGYDAVLVVAEPILGVRESRDRESAVAVGLGLAVLSPNGFEVRTIGLA